MIELRKEAQMVAMIASVLYLTLSIALPAWSDETTQVARRPNILFAISDDQSYPHASILGDPVVKTPAFDRIAREGVLFTHSFAACPSCTPSRSAILTGRQIWQLGEGALLFGTLHPEHTLFTHRLADAGYYVGFTGKPWAPGDWRARGLSRHPNGRDYAARLEVDPPVGINTRDYAANFEDFLADRPEGTPFMFWFGCAEPHREYDSGIGHRSGLSKKDVVVPPYLPDAPEVRSEILDYYYEIEHFDRHLSRMLKSLETLGELDHTIVVVTSDNGMPFSRTKTTLYDGGVRMPTAIRWGDRAPGGRRIDDFIGHIDFAPTFLEAAGVDIPGTVTGRSLIPLLTSDRSGRLDPDRDHVVTGLERHTYCRPGGATYPIRAIRTHEYLYIRNFTPERWPTGGPTFISSNKAPHGDIDDGPFKDFMLREQTRIDFPLAFELGFGKRPLEELYDTHSDPHQIYNLAEHPQHAEAKQKLWRRLKAHLEETADPRIDGKDPWQNYIYRQVEGFGATYNMSLTAQQRAAARARAKHSVSPGAKE
jgi:N-sulfoglucosamine sulfohydrolase